MISQQGTWGEVGVNDYIRDKTGEVWKVVDRHEHGRISVKNRAGRVAEMTKPPADQPVTRVVPTHDEAIQTVLTVLGGEVMVDTP
jgi:hypothetical protein